MFLQSSMDEKYESLSEFLKDFYIPTYVLSSSSSSEEEEEELNPNRNPPASPVLVFINSKSGGQLGGELLLTYRSLLNHNQVFDLGQETPDKVLRRIYLNMERLRDDDFACHIRQKLKIIVRMNFKISLSLSLSRVVLCASFIFN